MQNTRLATDGERSVTLRLRVLLMNEYNLNSGRTDDTLTCNYLLLLVRARSKPCLRANHSPARFSQALAKNRPQDQKLHPPHPPVTATHRLPEPFVPKTLSPRGKIERRDNNTRVGHIPALEEPLAAPLLSKPSGTRAGRADPMPMGADKPLPTRRGIN